MYVSFPVSLQSKYLGMVSDGSQQTSPMRATYWLEFTITSNFHLTPI